MPRVKPSSTSATTAIPVEARVSVPGVISKTSSSSTTIKVAATTPSTSAKKTSSRTKKTVTTPVEDVPVAVSPVPVEQLIEKNVEVVEESEAINTTTEEITTDLVEGEESATAPAKRTRRAVNKETIRRDFEALFTEYATELASKRRAPQKTAILKYLQKLQSDVFRVLKIRPEGGEQKKRSENNSGFMKPVRISSDLAKFINVDSSQPITRVMVTKKICEYIKEKDLQNPKDRREIFPDEPLREVFELEKDKTITYYTIQKLMQKHFDKWVPEA